MIKLNIWTIIVSVFVFQIEVNGKSKDWGKDVTRGLPVTPAQFPWYVVIEAVDINGLLHSCAGTIISTSWILASANCGFGANHFRLKFGAVNFTQSEIVINSTRIINHPYYDWDGALNNIALVNLPKPLQFSATINAINFPTKDIRKDQFVGEEAYYVGIIEDGMAEDYYQILRWGKSRVITDKECANITTHMLSEMCSIDDGPRQEKILCNTVPGSPLTIFKNNKFVQIGISSLSGCDKYPSIFTRVTLFLDWIMDVTGMKL